MFSRTDQISYGGDRIAVVRDAVEEAPGTAFARSDHPAVQVRKLADPRTCIWTFASSLLIGQAIFELP